jgi:hypothetical protein
LINHKWFDKSGKKIRSVFLVLSWFVFREMSTNKNTSQKLNLGTWLASCKTSWDCLGMGAYHTKDKKLFQSYLFGSGHPCHHNALKIIIVWHFVQIIARSMLLNLLKQIYIRRWMWNRFNRGAILHKEKSFFKASFLIKAPLSS